MNQLSASLNPFKNGDLTLLLPPMNRVLVYCPFLMLLPSEHSLYFNNKHLHQQLSRLKHPFLKDKDRNLERIKKKEGGGGGIRERNKYLFVA